MCLVHTFGQTVAKTLVGAPTLLPRQIWVRQNHVIQESDDPSVVVENMCETQQIFIQLLDTAPPKDQSQSAVVPRKKTKTRARQTFAVLGLVMMR